MEPSPYVTGCQITIIILKGIKVGLHYGNNGGFSPQLFICRTDYEVETEKKGFCVSRFFIKLKFKKNINLVVFQYLTQPNKNLWK